MSAALWRELEGVARRFAEEAESESRAALASSGDSVDQSPKAPVSWQERLWSAPHETRLSTTEISEALGKSVSWVHKRTSPRSGHVQIPHRRLNDGKLSFLAGEVRKWLIGLETHSNSSTALPFSSARNGRR
jgi:hypothetical protein